MANGARKPLVKTQFLTNAGVTYYTTPPTRPAITVVSSIVLANNTAAAHTATVGVNGVAAGNCILWAIPIPANSTFHIEASGESGIVILEAGDTLQALADANSAITLSVGGTEYANA